MEEYNMNFLKGRKSVRSCWLTAFWINLAVATLAIGPFLLRDYGYLAMSHDFTAQEIAFNMFMNDTIKSGNLLWNWGIDLGGNFLEAFSFYNVGSIFFWLTLLFPAKVIPRIMGCMLILKFAVAGATSAAYLGRHVQDKVIIIMASILYAFSGFQCTSVVFYHFQDAVALFPLLVLALEILVEDKKRGRLAAACLVNVLCNYVFFAGEVIFLVIYYVIKYLLPDVRAGRKKISLSIVSILQCMAEGIVGMAMAGILLVPSVCGTLANNRVSGHIPGKSWFSMDTENWLMLVKAFFMPAEAMNSYSSVVSANWMTNAAYLPLFGMVFVIAYIISKKDWISKTLKVCGVIAAVPIFNSMFMFFNSDADGYRRWFYMLTLIMVLATAKVAEQQKEYRIRAAAAISIVVLGIFILITKLVSWDYGRNSIIYNQKDYLIYLGMAFAGIVLTCMAAGIHLRYRTYIFTGLAAAFGATTLLFSIYHYQIKPDDTGLDFKTYGNSYAQNVVNYMTEVPAFLERNILPYRYCFDEGIGYTYYNMGMTNSLPTINSFISTVDTSVTEFYEELGIGRDVWTAKGAEGTRELLSVKYTVSLSKQLESTFLKTITNSNGQTMYLYENEDALPIGFTYDTYMTRAEFEQMDREVRSVAMLMALVVEEDDVSRVSPYLEHYDFKNQGKITVEGLDSALTERKKECGVDFEYGANYFKTVIHSDNNKYAFFSVPYDVSWKAQVNGEDADVLNINGLMAVRVAEGDNEIQFHYNYKPILLGFGCSMGGVLLFVGYMVSFRTKRNMVVQ